MKLLLSVIAVVILSNVFHTKGKVPPDSSLSGNTGSVKVKPVSSRIIRGLEVVPHSYPFMVALLVLNNIGGFCSGTLIEASWILTAAHCVQNNHEYIIMLGAHDWTNMSDPAMVKTRSSTFIIHEDFDSNGFRNDIALIKLPQPVNLNKYINTVPYINSTGSYANDIGTILGWGGGEHNVSVVLRGTSTEILTNEECAAVDLFKGHIFPTNMCVSGAGGVGTCTGDSGGPLLVNGIQIGIASFQNSSCGTGTPSVFTRLSNYHDWIRQHLTDGSNSLRNLRCLLLLSVLIHLGNATGMF